MKFTDEKTIKLSRTKTALLILGSFAFVGLGLWMLSLDQSTIESHRRYNSPLFVYGVGTVAVIFFGACGILGVKKFFENKPGLVLSSAGIFDNSSAFSAGFIPWP